MKIFHKLLLIILLIQFQYPSKAQRIGISGGANLSHYYDYKEMDFHYITDYKNGFGYSLSLFADNLFQKDSIIPLKLRLKYSNYRGHAIINYSGLSGGDNKDINIKKSSLGIGVFPLNFSIENFFISIGFDVELLLFDNSTGKIETWSLLESKEIKDLNKIDNKYLTYGISCEIQYEIPINEAISIFPKYSTHLELCNDLYDTNVWRNYFEIGLLKKIK